MKKEEWEKICRNIYENKCILLLGPEFPLELTGSNETTSFSKRISNRIIEEIKLFDRTPPSFVLDQLGCKELSQVACDYISYKSGNRSVSREDLEILLSDYLSELDATVGSTAFENLSSLPFTFIVNTNYTHFFANLLEAAGKKPETAYYNFKGNKIDLVNSVSNDGLGSELNPFIFNLFGSIEDPSSLVLSENDLVQFIINIISRNPGLPANVKSELANQEKVFLFLGFGFYAKNWYFRILLQALESNNKGKMSYALECIDRIDNHDNNPVVLFFRDELKVSLCTDTDQKQFVEDLVNYYHSYADKKKNISIDKLQLENAPKAFISYKSEDFAFANDLYQRLRKLGINAWLDRDRLQGNWAQSIANEISNSDAFVLIQSQQVKNSPVNYLNVEIKKAIERAEYFPSNADFIFPTIIDSNDSLITTYPILNAINSYDLTKSEKIDQLAKDIKRSFERNKRKRAA